MLAHHKKRSNGRYLSKKEEAEEPFTRKDRLERKKIAKTCKVSQVGNLDKMEKKLLGRIHQEVPLKLESRVVEFFVIG